MAQFLITQVYSFNLNQEQLASKAVKALNMLLINFKKLPLKPKTLCQLFDAFVGSILGYASEIWGYSKSKEIEPIHLKFCKRILHVKLSCNNASVYDELGRYPLYVSRYVRMVKYWCKIQNSENILINHLYNESLKLCNKGCNFCYVQCKKMLIEYGFLYVFDEHFEGYQTTIFFKQIVIDVYIQEWHGCLERNQVLLSCKHCKTNFN